MSRSAAVELALLPPLLGVASVTVTDERERESSAKGTERDGGKAGSATADLLLCGA